MRVNRALFRCGVSAWPGAVKDLMPQKIPHQQKPNRLEIVFPQIDPLSSVMEMLHKIDDKLTAANGRLKNIEMNIQDAIDKLAAENVKLDDIGAKLTEGFTEISALIGQLQNTELTPEQEAIVTALEGKVDAIQPQAQQIADIVPNP